MNERLMYPAGLLREEFNPAEEKSLLLSYSGEIKSIVVRFVELVEQFPETFSGTSISDYWCDLVEEESPFGHEFEDMVYEFSDDEIMGALEDMLHKMYPNLEY